MGSSSVITLPSDQQLLGLFDRLHWTAAPQLVQLHRLAKYQIMVIDYQ